MSNNNNDNLNLQVSLGGVMPPAMQRVLTGNGANVPTMQAVSPTGQITSQQVVQGSHPQQTSAVPAKK